MPDDIARWKRERAELQEMIDAAACVTVRDQDLVSPQVALLKARIVDLDRHIAALEKRRT